MEEKNNYTMLNRILNYINVFGFVWVLVTCIFHFIDLPYWFTYGGMYTFCTTWCLECVVEKRWRNWTMSREKYFYVLLLIFFVVGICYYPWDGTVYFKHHTELRYPLLGVGIVGLFGVNELYSKKLIFRTMVIISVASVLFLYMHCGLENLIHSSNRIFLLAEARKTYVNAHMGFNYFLNVSLMGLWYLIFHTDEKRRWLQAFYVLAGLVILSALFLSDGRSGLGMGLLVMLALLVYELWQHSHAGAIILMVAGLSFSTWMLTTHPRISNGSLNSELRFCYWHSALDLIKDRPIHGYGVSTAQEEFDKVNMQYVPEHCLYFWNTREEHYIDSHNQYIQTTLEFGLLGLLLLLTIYLIPIWLVDNDGRIITIAIAALSIGQSMVDIFITGQFALIYGLMMLTCLSMHDRQ